MSLQLAVKEVNDIIVAEVGEERLTSDNVPAFKKQLKELVALGRNRILLNLRSVEFMDSLALGTLVAVNKEIPEDGIMALCNMHEMVEKIFKLTRIDKVFTIYADESIALDEM